MYHKLGGTKHQQFMIVWFWRLEVWNQVWAGNLRENLLSASHLASGSCPQSLCSLTVVTSLSPYLPQCLYPNFSLVIRTSLIGLWPTTFRYDLILTWLCLQRCYFQIRSHSQVLGVRIWTYLFKGGGHSSSHNKQSIVFFSSYCVSQIQAMVLYFSSFHCQLLWKVPHSVWLPAITGISAFTFLLELLTTGFHS